MLQSTGCDARLTSWVDAALALFYKAEMIPWRLNRHLGGELSLQDLGHPFVKNAFL